LRALPTKIDVRLQHLIDCKEEAVKKLQCRQFLQYATPRLPSACFFRRGMIYASISIPPNKEQVMRTIASQLSAILALVVLCVTATEAGATPTVQPLAFSNFTVTFVDTSGDGMLQHDEISAFSGVHYFGNTYLGNPIDTTYAEVSTVPNQAGISTYSGFQYDGQNPASWLFDVGTSPSIPGSVLGKQGFGAGYWSYQLTRVGDTGNPVPEPSSLLLATFAMAAMALALRRKY
jgi:hypothetical protein